MRNAVIRNNVKVLLFTAALGAFAGAVLWAFLKAVTLCTQLFWEIIPESSGNPFVSIIFCVAGGLALGVIHKKYGNYPDDLNTVMGQIKKNKYYDYRPMPVMLICAFIPLILGVLIGTYSSVFLCSPILYELAKGEKQPKYVAATKENKKENKNK